MKASDNFKIDQAWWSKNKPATLPSTGLGEAMKKYKEAQDTIARLVQAGAYTGEFATKVTPFEAAATVLTKDIPAAVAKAKAKCNKTLHKDCLTVLDKCPKAVAAEMQALQQQETDFNRTYKAQRFTPVMTQATQIEQRLSGDVQAAQGLVKQADETSKLVLQRFAYLKGLEKSGTQEELDVAQAKFDVKGDVAKVEKIAADLAEMLKTAEKDEKTASQLDAAIKKDLSFRDQDEVRRKLNAVASLKNYILEASKRAEMLKAAVHSNKQEFKANVSGKAIPVAKQIQLLKELRDSTTGSEGAARKLENAFTNILLGLPKMTKAIKAAPSLDAIVIPPEVNVPPERWVQQVQEWHALAETHKKKITQLHKEAEAAQKKLFALVDKDVLAQGEGKTLKAEIEAKYEGIKVYEGKCDGDVQAFDRALQTLKDEFAKRVR